MPAKVQIDPTHFVIADSTGRIALVGGACCLPDDTCEFEGSEDECLALDPAAIWKPDEKCTPNPCLVGACCLPGGGCSNMTEADCDDAGGGFDGNGSDCSTTECIYACCEGSLDHGSCTPRTFDDCQPPYRHWKHGQHCGSTDETDPCWGCCSDIMTRGYMAFQSNANWDVLDTDPSGSFCHNAGYQSYYLVYNQDCTYIRDCQGSYTLSGTDCSSNTVILYKDASGTCDWHCVTCDTPGGCSNSCVSPPSTWCDDPAHLCCMHTNATDGCGYVNYCNYNYTAPGGGTSISGYDYREEFYSGINMCYPFTYRC